MDNKSDRRRLYYDYCTRYREDIPIFYLPWYLDAACMDGEWDAVIYVKGGITWGVWPYFFKTKYGIRYITMPPLTPCMGPIYHLPDDLARPTRYSREKEILTELNAQLPRTHLVSVYRSADTYSSLSLRSLGYEIHRRYTYRLSLSPRPASDMIFAKQAAAIRRADDIYTLRVDDTADDHIHLNDLTYARQGLQCPYDAQTFLSIESALRERQSRTILIANDSTGTPRASIYLVHDHTTVYLMAIGSDSDGRRDGGVAWLIAQALERYSDTHQVFDFEGSMIPRIERFFRSFGGEQVGYDHLIRTSGPLMRTLLALTGRI